MKERVTKISEQSAEAVPVEAPVPTPRTDEDGNVQAWVEVTADPSGKRRYTLRGGPREVEEVETATRTRMAQVGESISERQAILAGLLTVPGREGVPE